MLTMNRSRLAMKRPIEVTARTFQRCAFSSLLSAGRRGAVGGSLAFHKAR
jgi:hypothetical protein